MSGCFLKASERFFAVFVPSHLDLFVLGWCVVCCRQRQNTGYMQNSLLWDSRSLSASFSRVTGSRIKRSPALSETSNQSTFSTHDLERPLVVQILEILHDVQKKLNNFREETGYPLFTIRKELNVLFVRLFVCLFLFLFVLFSLRNMGIKLFLYADQPYINNFPSALLSSGFSIETADNFH